MGAILAILANPVVTRPISRFIGWVFGGRKADDKVSAPVAALTALSVILGILGQVDPSLADVVRDNVTPEMITGISAAIVAFVGYFKPEGRG